LPQRTIILAAGGSGGHVFPALALSESLVMRGWNVFLVTDNRGEAFTNEFPKQVQKLVINFPNPWSGGKIAFINSIWFFIKGIVSLIVFCRKVKVTTIIGFGGYPSAASMFAACILRLPSAIHEQNSVLGRVNKLFSNRVDLLVFGINPLVKPKRTARMLILGNPIRKSVLQVFPIEYSELKFDPFVVLVLGGSQGASFVSSIVCDSIAGLPFDTRKKLRIFHQCRQEDIERVQNKYAKYKVNSDVKIFFDDISDHLNNAHLIISRSGASSLAEFCVFGRPSILIPLPSAVGNHQAKNAAVMKEAGASLVLSQESVSIADLRNKILHILNNFQIANDMSMSAKKLSKPDAAENLADELEKLK
jgi:UDP-N-acetylglucosamine--N-acetylmuramyl-(pentapeptide) pyrophosphoryl-undecaprenol N-acetylglucosamine transferase